MENISRFGGATTGSHPQSNTRGAGQPPIALVDDSFGVELVSFVTQVVGPTAEIMRALKP